MRNGKCEGKNPRGCHLPETAAEKKIPAGEGARDDQNAQSAGNERECNRHRPRYVNERGVHLGEPRFNHIQDETHPREENEQRERTVENKKSRRFMVRPAFIEIPGPVLPLVAQTAIRFCCFCRQSHLLMIRMFHTNIIYKTHGSAKRDYTGLDEPVPDSSAEKTEMTERT
jgi:hypothetical protein